jgi:hypothetical protein
MHRDCGHEAARRINISAFQFQMKFIREMYLRRAALVDFTGPTGRQRLLLRPRWFHPR